ncbi:MAG: hypothetical protein KJZ65_07960 [Phycisphaerales bacterium]|nr:hypothetical protein [Phycisphaerales bacterium]
MLQGNIQSAKIKTVAGGGGSGDPGVFIGSGDYKDTLACTIELAGDIDIPGNIGDEATVQVASIPSGYSVTVGGDVEAGGEVQVLGDLAGTLDVTGDIGGTVTIYDGLSGTITCGSAGLAAQILVNQQNGSAEWSGDVVIGSTTLGPGETGDYQAPYYGVLSSTLGGGAVGLVPFNFHPKDSAPDHDSVVTTGALSTVQIAHYGPVSVASGNGVRVFEGSWAIPIGYSEYNEIPLCSGPAYWDEWDGEGDFDVSVSGRVITITGDERTFTTGKAYQIIPDGLVCAGIPGTPDVVYISNWFGAWDEDNDEFCDGLPETNGYGFVIPSKFDLNLSLELETGDVDTWLTEPVDLDDDDDADVLDLAAVIDAVVNGSDE